MAWSARRWLLVALLCTLVVYLPGLGAAATGDDLFLATAVRHNGVPNPMIAQWQGLWGYFGANYWRGAIHSDELYRPLPILSYAVVHQVFGRSDVLVQHVLNLVLHLCAVAGVFVLVQRLRRGSGLVGDRAAGIAALVFGLHAIHHEAVIQIVGRAELLAFTGGLGGTLAVLQSLATHSWRRVVWLTGSLLAFAAAFLSKESALAWVAFAPLVIAGCQPSGQRLRAAGLALLIAAVAAGGYWGLRSMAMEDVPKKVLTAVLANPLASESTGARILTAIKIQGYVLSKVLLPLSLFGDYGPVTFSIVRDPLDPAYIAAGTILLLLLVSGLLMLRRCYVLFLAIAVYFGFFFGVSNVPFAIGTVFGERLAYTPSLAVALLAAWLASWRSLGYVLVPWCLWCAALILFRHSDYRDIDAMTRADVQKNPASIRLQNEMASVEIEAKNLDAAIARLQQAAAALPDIPLTLYNLADAQFAKGNYPDAATNLGKGLASPHLNQREEGFRLHWLMAQVLRATGDRDGAFERLLTAHSANPDHVDSLIDLVELGFRMRKPAEVLTPYIDKGSKLAPRHWCWSAHRGWFALDRRDGVRAEMELREALKLWPPSRGYPFQLIVPLAESLLRQGRKGEAQELLNKQLEDRRLPQEHRPVLEQLLESAKRG